jgi:hypothetical protein
MDVRRVWSGWLTRKFSRRARYEIENPTLCMGGLFINEFTFDY